MAKDAALAATGPARRLVFLGPPGSGKGTQAEVLAAELGVPAISTGVMLREAVEAGSELGKRVERIMLDGLLVDDETMAAVVRERVAKDDAARGFILDGFPRTLEQVATLESILAEAGARLDATVLIEVPEAELVARSLGRGRPDDTEETIRARLAVYHDKTAPLIGYYRDRGLLRPIDGLGSIPEITRRIQTALAAPDTPAEVAG